MPRFSAAAIPPPPMLNMPTVPAAAPNLGIRAVPLPGLPPSALQQAQVGTVRVHGNSLAAMPDRTPHPNLPGRDIHGRTMPGVTVTDADKMAHPPKTSRNNRSSSSKSGSKPSAAKTPKVTTPKAPKAPSMQPPTGAMMGNMPSASSVFG